MSVLKRYVWLIVVVVVIIGLYLIKPPNGGDAEVNDVPVILEEEREEKTSSSNFVKVDVKGAVNIPGVYTMSEDNRVVDAIKEAGGMTDQADPESVNLAQRIQDEMMIIVSLSSEDEQVEPGTVSGDKVKINRASASEIQALNGIGPSKAESIIKYREENGPFFSVEELVEVPGIGEKTLENLKEQIIVP